MICFNFIRIIIDNDIDTHIVVFLLFILDTKAREREGAGEP